MASSISAGCYSEASRHERSATGGAFHTSITDVTEHETVRDDPARLTGLCIFNPIAANERDLGVKSTITIIVVEI